jgi:hypothetical protein
MSISRKYLQGGLAMSGKRIIVIVSFTLVVSLLLCVPYAYSGWIAEERDGGTTLISKGKIRNVPQEADEMWTIVDVNAGLMTWISDNKRMYARGNAEDFCDATKAVMAQVQSNMSPEERQMMEQMMGMMGGGRKGGRKPDVSAMKAGSGDIIAGMKTEKYHVMVDGKLYEEIWIATDRSMLKELGNVKKFGETMQKFTSCTAGSFGMGMLAEQPEFSPEYSSLYQKGWIMRNIKRQVSRMGGMGSEPDTEVIRLEKKDISKSEFKVPAGYRQVTLSELFRSMGGM